MQSCSYHKSSLSHLYSSKHPNTSLHPEVNRPPSSFPTCVQYASGASAQTLHFLGHLPTNFSTWSFTYNSTLLLLLWRYPVQHRNGLSRFAPSTPTSPCATTPDHVSLRDSDRSIWKLDRVFEVLVLVVFDTVAHRVLERSSV